MTTINNQELNILAADSTQSLVSANSASSTQAPNSIHEVSFAGESVNTDNVEVTNSAAQSSTLRSADELYNSIAAICAKYGINISDAKKFNLLERIAGFHEGETEKLLNMDNSEVKKLIECLEAALRRIAKPGEKVNLEDVAKLANNYNIAIHTGWSIEGFEKANHNNNESLNARLKRFFGKSDDFDITKLSKEERKDLIYSYFKQYFDSMINKGKSAEEVYKLQLQDFGKLLVNSTDEEKAIFEEAIKALANENKLDGLKSVLRSFETKDGRSAFADRLSFGYFEDMLNTPDCEGNLPSDELVGELVSEATQFKTEDGIRETHTELNQHQKELYEANAEIIDTYKNKIKKAEAEKQEALTEQEIKDLLTDEEFAIYKLEKGYLAIQTGETTGTTINCIISDDIRDVLIDTMNQDAYELPNYREFLSELIKYIEKHPEVKMPNGQNVTEYLEKHTNGNLSRVAEDIKNGTKSELNAPAPTETKTAAASSSSASTTAAAADKTSLGFASKPAPAQKAEQQVYQAAEKSSEDDGIITKEEAIKGGLVEFNKYTKKMGFIEKIQFIFADAIKNITLKQRGYDIIRRANVSEQEIAYESIHDGSAKGDILTHNVLEDSLVLRLNGNSYIENQYLKKEQKEIKEKQERQNLNFGIA